MILIAFGLVTAQQNRDLLRARAYREFILRIIPLALAAVLVAGLPFIVNLATIDKQVIVLFVYLAGTALLISLATRSVAPEERRASTAFREEDYEKAASAYQDLINRTPLARYYSAMGASLDAAGNHLAAVEATTQAIKLDPRLGIAYYNRASARAALGQLSSARRDLQAVFRADSPKRLRKAAEEALNKLGKGNPEERS